MHDVLNHVSHTVHTRTRALAHISLLVYRLVYRLCPCLSLSSIGLSLFISLHFSVSASRHIYVWGYKPIIYVWGYKPITIVFVKLNKKLNRVDRVSWAPSKCKYMSSADTVIFYALQKHKKSGIRFKSTIPTSIGYNYYRLIIALTAIINYYYGCSVLCCLEFFLHAWRESKHLCMVVNHRERKEGILSPTSCSTHQ